MPLLLFSDALAPIFVFAPGHGHEWTHHHPRLGCVEAWQGGHDSIFRQQEDLARFVACFSADIFWYFWKELRCFSSTFWSRGELLRTERPYPSGT